MAPFYNGPPTIDRRPLKRQTWSVKVYFDRTVYDKASFVAPVSCTLPSSGFCFSAGLDGIEVRRPDRIDIVESAGQVNVIETGV